MAELLAADDVLELGDARVRTAVERDVVHAEPAGPVHLDPERRHLITAANQHSKTDYNLYEGTEVTGTPDVVILRGNVLVENGELVAEPGIGQFVERAAFGQELLPAAAR